MPLVDAMETQRAVRRLRPDPVDDDTVLPVLELATKAPTGSNLQSWEFVVVRDPDVKHQLARLNRQAWSIYRRLGKRKAKGDEPTLKILDAVQWQADHFEDVPVIVVACLHGRSPVFGRRSWRRAATARSSRRCRTCCSRPGPSASAPPSRPCPSGRPRWPAAPSGCPPASPRCAVVPMGWPTGATTARRPANRSRDVVHLDRYGNRPFR